MFYICSSITHLKLMKERRLAGLSHGDCVDICEACTCAPVTLSCLSCSLLACLRVCLSNYTVSCLR